MKKYSVTIKTVAVYLQARFSERAQNELKVKAGSKAQVDDNEMWKDLAYMDKKGFYIPTMQIKGSLVNGGKGIKKKPYGSFKDTVKAYLFIEEDKIYLNKTEPDFVNISYPPRKDGLRVKVCHPAFNVGLELTFNLICLNDNIDQKTLELICEKAGYEAAIGAWRPEHGRYVIKSFNIVD